MSKQKNESNVWLRNAEDPPDAFDTKVRHNHKDKIHGLIRPQKINKQFPKNAIKAAQNLDLKFDVAELWREITQTQKKERPVKWSKRVSKINNVPP